MNILKEPPFVPGTVFDLLNIYIEEYAINKQINRNKIPTKTYLHT